MSSWMALLVVINSAAFLVYALDKAQAMAGGWRIPESTLLLFALLGGWPGAWAAQRIFRHKTRKTAFQVAFWASAVGNLAFIAAILAWTEAIP